MDLLSFGKTGWGDELFYATLMTIAVAVTAMLIGFLFSLIFTPLKLSNNKFLNFIGNTYTTVIRGVPELLVIYLFFFGGSASGHPLPEEDTAPPSYLCSEGVPPHRSPPGAFAEHGSPGADGTQQD